jgi:hypothetical protein
MLTATTSELFVACEVAMTAVEGYTIVLYYSNAATPSMVGY